MRKMTATGYAKKKNGTILDMSIFRQDRVNGIIKQEITNRICVANFCLKLNWK